MQHWLTAAELAGLAGMPSSEFRTRAKLQKLGVPSRLREGRAGGGGREYDCSKLPPETRRALLVKSVERAPEVLPAEVPPIQTAVVPVSPARVPPTRKQGTCADARTLLVRRLADMTEGGAGITKATEVLAKMLAAGQAPAELLDIAAAANQRPRAADAGVQLSARTLFRWHAAHKEGGWEALLPAPTSAHPIAAVQHDVAAVLKAFHSAQGAARNLTEVAQAVQRSTTGAIDGWKPLYDRARRALPKVDQVKLIKARHTGAERAAKLPYMRRKTGNLMPLDVCLVDGHTFKAKVRHPDHGQPFAPEVTVLLDAATRKICGWSVALSENVIAVGDCIRHAATTHGVWAIYYTDNGPGEKNKQFDCPVAGLFIRLGARHELGRPGHPQGHGLIERSWRTHMIRCARQFGSFQGSDADSGKVRALRLEVAREVTAIKKAEPGQIVQLTAKVPSWERFIEAVATEVERYNTEHRHRSLPKHTEGPFSGDHMTPAEAWNAWLDPADQHLLDGPHSRMLHMPAKVATAQRGWVVLNKASYFNQALMQVDGQKVRVHFDIHDPRAVWIWSLQGEFVCEAGLDANAMDYFPPSVVQQAKEQRAKRRIGLREEQIELARAELGLPAPNAEFQAAGMRPFTAPKATEYVERVEPQRPPQQATAPDGRPVMFDTAAARYEWLMQHRNQWQGDDATWLAGYVSGRDYADLRDYFDSRGIAWVDDDAAFNQAG